MHGGGEGIRDTELLLKEARQAKKKMCNNHLINMEIYEYLKLPHGAKYMSNIGLHLCPVFEPRAIL